MSKPNCDDILFRWLFMEPRSDPVHGPIYVPAFYILLRCPTDCGIDIRTEISANRLGARLPRRILPWLDGN